MFRISALFNQIFKRMSNWMVNRYRSYNFCHFDIGLDIEKEEMIKTNKKKLLLVLPILLAVTVSGCTIERTSSGLLGTTTTVPTTTTTSTTTTLPIETFSGTELAENLNCKGTGPSCTYIGKAPSECTFTARHTCYIVGIGYKVWGVNLCCPGSFVTNHYINDKFVGKQTIGNCCRDPDYHYGIDKYLVEKGKEYTIKFEVVNWEREGSYQEACLLKLDYECP